MNEDFSLGKMSADARLTATFKYYEKTEQNGKIPVFRILFNIPSIFFDVLRGIVGVCVLLTPRNDIIGSSVIIFSTDTLVQVIQ